MRVKILILGVPLLLGACEMKIGKDDTSAGNTTALTVADNGNVSIAAADGAQGVSISVPGFEAKVKMPGLDLNSADMDIDGIKLYPGTKLQTVDVNGNDDKGSGVAMRFSSPAAPATIAQYYAEAARSHDFTNVSVNNDNGKSTVIATKPDGDKLTIAMAPDAKSGTQGTISVIDVK